VPRAARTSSAPTRQNPSPATTHVHRQHRLARRARLDRVRRQLEPVDAERRDVELAPREPAPGTAGLELAAADDVLAQR